VHIEFLQYTIVCLPLIGILTLFYFNGIIAISIFSVLTVCTLFLSFITVDDYNKTSFYLDSDYKEKKGNHEKDN